MMTISSFYIKHLRIFIFIFNYIEIRLFAFDGSSKFDLKMYVFYVAKNYESV